jgi:archaellum component FlaC
MDPNSDKGKREEKNGAGAEPASLNQLIDLLAPIGKQLDEVKKEVKEVKQGIIDVRREVKEEFDRFRKETDSKFEGINADMKTQHDHMEEAQTRVAELEEWQVEAKSEMLAMMTQTLTMQEKMTDLEGRLRRNNIRIFGIPGDTEGNSTSKYLERFLTTELELPSDTPLQIQRAHRALAQKPPPNAPPRSMVDNFLQFETKEMVLSHAWKRKIHVGGKRIFFDHDYATEVVQKRKAYIKKILKEEQIRFQTPLARMRIHWGSGAKTYDSAEDVARDMKERGYEVDLPREGAAIAGREKTRDRAEWQQATRSRTGRMAAAAAKEKLRGFQRGK